MVRVLRKKRSAEPGRRRGLGHGEESRAVPSACHQIAGSVATSWLFPRYILPMFLTLAEAAPHSLSIFDAAVALLTLTLLEIVLGIDNIVFIAILCGRLPEHQRAKARQIGLSLALITRIAFLSTITLIMGLAKAKLFTIGFLTRTIHENGTDISVPVDISGRDLILILGGLFLLYKAVHEIHAKVEGDASDQARTVESFSSPRTDSQPGSHGNIPAPTPQGPTKSVKFSSIILQILLIDIVFSIDSVITAVGMAQQLWIMITAVVISVGIMLLASGGIAAMIEKHPTLKVLALSFLMLIGVVLIADGFGQHIPKGYIYFSMAFALTVEVINIRVRAKSMMKPQ